MRIVTTCGFLAAGYLGYTQAFALLSRHVAIPPNVPKLPYDPSPSRSSREASQLALDAFGPGHWASKARIRFYESERGFWIYADDYKRKENGKRYDFVPFALIWRDRNGKAIKTVTSNEATVVFNSAPDMVRGTKKDEPSRVVEATLAGDVRIRDDKGTPNQLGDDLTIAIDDLHYDGKKDTISSDKRLVLEERDTMATGEGLAIELLPGDHGGQGMTNGYTGARTVRLLHDVRIAIQDVGQSGIVPGGTAAKTDLNREPRPGEITCDGEMRIDLPQVRRLPPLGPPAPATPTFANFARNVRVRQGDAQAPEQIDCDRLQLTLIPAARPDPEESTPQFVVATTEPTSDPNSPDQQASTAPPTPPSADSGSPGRKGPVANLALDRARATGHAVWLQSKVYGLVARGNELTYHRGAPGENDVTYFRGDRGTETHHKNPAEGTEDIIHTVDVTIHKNSHDEGNMSVVARGPGWLETRRESDQVLLRSGKWNEQLVIQPVEGDPTRRLLTLDGAPELIDTRQGTLDATRKIVATLVSTPKPEAETQTNTGTGKSSNAVRIEQMQAWGTVHLVSNGPLPAAENEDSGPAGIGSASRRTITAREWLGVVFEAPPQEAQTKAASTGSPVAEKSTTPAETLKANTPASEPPGPTDPAINVESDRIWAWLATGPSNATDSLPKSTEPAAATPSETSGTGKWDMREVRLRGRVIVHQDPPPGKSKGMDVEGESIDVLNQGNKLYEVRAYGAGERIARATTDEFLIEGPVIGLDQLRNTACVIGAGKLVQNNAGTGVLGNAMGDPGVVPTAFQVQEAAAEKEPTKPRGPLSIAWGRDADGKPMASPDGKPVDAWMKFYGRPTAQNGGAETARVQFHNGVRAWTRESVLRTREMWAYFDGPIDLAKPGKLGGNKTVNANKPDSAPDEPKPLAQISRVICEGDADVETRKFNDQGLLVEKRHITGERLVYERNNNRFHVDSAGILELWDLKSKNKAGGGNGIRRPDLPMATPGRTRVRPASDQPRGQGIIRPAAGRIRLVADSNEVDGTLRFTRIWFGDQMVGQVDTTRKGTKRYPGQAEFFGNVRVISAEVPDENTNLDPDDPPLDFMYTVSETLRVISEPPLPGAPQDGPDRILVQSWHNVYGLTGRQGRSTSIYTQDHVDYNSETGVSYVYGGENGVQIVDKAAAGKQASYGGGSVVMYNHRTGEHHISDVKGLQLVDPNSGMRTGIPPTPPPTTTPKPKRKVPRISPNDKERRGFNGGTR